MRLNERIGNWGTPAFVVFLLTIGLVWPLSPRPVPAQFPFRQGPDYTRPIISDVDVDEAGGDARKFLDQVDAFLQDGQWSEAVDAVQKVTAEYGDKVVLVQKAPNGFRHYASVRDFCQRRLVDPKHAAVLDVYRPRIDPLAKQWYEEGIARRDEKLLRRIVDEAFAGSWTDEALFALGELALSRGDAASARAAWTRIFPPDPNQPAAAAAAYPDSDLKPADVDARLVLASILQNDRARAREELENALRGGPGFAQRYPETRGRLGGKEGKYVDLLRDLLKQSESWPATRPSDDWPTFAGDYERNAIAPAAVAVAGKAWKQPIELRTVSVMPAAISREYSLRRVGEASGRPLVYFPAVSGNRLVIHQQVPSADNAQMAVDQILVHDLETGGPAGAEPVIYTSDKWPFYSYKSLGVPRFTTTIHNDRIFACVGPVAPWEFGDAPELMRQSIVCLDFVGRSGWPGEYVSGHRLPAGWRAEGAPICDGPRLYVMLREITPAKEHSHVACFDAENGRRLWTRKLASGDVRARSTEGESEITNSLLTLAHGTLYANTNLGVVAALDGADGRVKWTTSFPRSAQMDLRRPLGFFYRDLNPCVYHEGLVFVAPNDTPAVFALDAATGRVWWSVDLPDVTHLIGAVGDKVIASGDRLYWLQFDRAHPEAGAKLATWYGDGDPPGYGRGTLVGDVVYWPTEAEIHIFDQRTGVRRGLISLFAEPAFREKTGNLTVAGGKLLVAQPDRIVAFNQFSRRQRDDAEGITKKRHDDAQAWFDLARCEEALGDLEPAATHFRAALERARPGDLRDGRPLADQARERLCGCLARRADELTAAGNRDEAAGRLEAAASVAVSPLEKLAYRLTAAETLAVAPHGSAAAIDAYSRLASDRALASLSVEDEAGRPTAAPRLVAARLAALDRASPAEAGPAPTPRAIDEPVRPTLWAVAPGVDWLCDRIVVPRGEPPVDQAAVVAVRTAANRARFAKEHPEAAASFGDAPPGDVVEIVRPSDRAVRAVLPLDAAIVFASWTADRSTLVVVSETEAAGVDVAAGRVVWRTPLADPPVRASDPFAAPVPRATTPWGAFRPGRADGRVLRRFSLDAPPSAGDWRVGDFGAIEQALLAGDRLVVRQGNARVLGLDPRTGDVVWARSSDVGPLARSLAATSDRVVIQSAGAKLAIALDARDGRETSRVDLATLGPWPSGWPAAPAALDARRIVAAVAPDRLACLDLDAGRVVWSRPTLGDVETPAAPLAVGDKLLVFLNDHGVTRLDPATGEPVWSGPVRISSKRSPGLIERVACDGETLFAVADGVLRAIRLEDGRPRFDRPEFVGRPETAYATRFLSGVIAAFPLDSFSPRPELTILSAADGRVVQRAPLAVRDPWPVFSWRRPATHELVGRAAIVSTHGAVWPIRPR